MKSLRVERGPELISALPLPSLLPLSCPKLPCWKADQRVGSVSNCRVCSGGRTLAPEPIQECRRSPGGHQPLVPWPLFPAETGEEF